VRRGASVLLLALSTATATATAGTEPPPPLSVQDAIQPPGVLQMRLSPDGQHLAAVVYNGVNPDVMILRSDTLAGRSLVRDGWLRDGFYLLRKQARGLHWITPTLLAVDHGLVGESVNLDGKPVARLGNGVIGKAVPGDPQNTLVLVFDDEKHKSFAVVDAATGRSRSLRLPASGQPLAWAFDDRGELRAVTLASSEFWNDRTLVAQWYRRADGSWLQMEETPLPAERWEPLAARSDRDELVVRARHERDTAAIFSYDPIERRFGALLAGQASEDTATLDDPRVDALRGVLSLGMKPQQRWFDPGWAALQAEVNLALPGRVNSLSGDLQGLVLIHSTGDVDPGAWKLLDTRTMEMRHIVAARKRIDPQAMRPMEVLRYAARDGLQIPAYLTKPAASGPQPMVVLVHGGPWVRDHWQWDAEVQLLAARGYAVFQPQFRGSSGFGKRFEEAGFGEWGRAMQNDITDGVRHLIATGVADPQRICISGASYGGYAAVWGLIDTPQLYRCGITVAGVSDIAQLFSDWSDSTAASRELLRWRVGDETRDRARLDAVSPLKRAADIRAPLLIAHGDDDVRVLIGHARRLMRAMEQAGRRYEWLPLPDEGHGLSLLSSQKLYYERMLDFLQRHIGPPPPAAQAASDNPRP
jgi:dipeptidyl aminopeptidase/acylaminoacyl peptidase